MNKKVITVLCAAILLGLGGFLLSRFPSQAAFITFVEFLIGFGGGFFLAKFIKDDEISDYQKSVQTLFEENQNLKETVEKYENREVEDTVAKLPKKRKPRKPVEEPKGE